MKPDKTTVDYLKTYFVRMKYPTANGEVRVPKDISRLIFNYAYLEDWMKTANDLAKFFKSPSLTFITSSPLWNNDPTLTKAKAWLFNPVAPHVNELDTFYKETIQPLVQFLATCKLVDSIGTTPLMWAARNGHTESVKALLAVPGIDVNAKNNYDQTALIYAAALHGSTESVKALLGVPGIDVNAQSQYGSTALILAARDGHTESVKALLGVPGIDVNAKSKYDWTALIFTASNGHAESVKALLAAPDIDVNAKDADGRTALMLAARNGHTECANLIREHLRQLKAQAENDNRNSCITL